MPVDVTYLWLELSNMNVFPQRTSIVRSQMYLLSVVTVTLPGIFRTSTPLWPRTSPRWPGIVVSLGTEGSSVMALIIIENNCPYSPCWAGAYWQEFFITCRVFLLCALVILNTYLSRMVRHLGENEGGPILLSREQHGYSGGLAWSGVKSKSYENIRDVNRYRIGFRRSRSIGNTYCANIYVLLLTVIAITARTMRRRFLE